MSDFVRGDYEALLYTLADRFPEVAGSSVRLYTHSATTAFVRGSVVLQSGLELRIFEYLT